MSTNAGPEPASDAIGKLRRVPVLPTRYSSELVRASQVSCEQARAVHRVPVPARAPDDHDIRLLIFGDPDDALDLPLAAAGDPHEVVAGDDGDRHRIGAVAHSHGDDGQRFTRRQVFDVTGGGRATAGMVDGPARDLIDRADIRADRRPLGGSVEREPEVRQAFDRDRSGTVGSGRSARGRRSWELRLWSRGTIPCPWRRRSPRWRRRVRTARSHSVGPPSVFGSRRRADWRATTGPLQSDRPCRAQIRSRRGSWRAAAARRRGRRPEP